MISAPDQIEDSQASDYLQVLEANNIKRRITERHESSAKKSAIFSQINREHEQSDEYVVR